MYFKDIIIKMVRLFFFITIFVGAGNEQSDVLFIQDSKNLIKEVRVGLQPAQHAVVVVLVANCKDAAQEAHFLINKSIANTAYAATCKSTIIEGAHESISLQVCNMHQDDSSPIVIIKKENQVSFWSKCKWVAMGAGVCAFACGILSLISSSSIISHLQPRSA